VTFVKELLIVAAGALGKGHEVKHFGSVGEGGIFPDRWVSSKSTTGVPGALSLKETRRLYSMFERDQ